MTAKKEVKRCTSSRGVSGAVGRMNYLIQGVFPACVLLFWQCAQHLKQSLVKPLNLSIALGVVWGVGARMLYST